MLRRQNSKHEKEIEFYEKRFDDANRFFKHTLTAISSVIVIVTILVTVNLDSIICLYYNIKIN